MRVLFDENVPRSLRRHLRSCFVMTAVQMNWDHLRNGALLALAEEAEFDVLLTADQGIFYQQDNRKRHISLVVLSSTHRLSIIAAAALILDAVGRASSGSFEFVTIPRLGRRSWGPPSKMTGTDGDA